MEQYVKYLRKSRFDRDYADLSVEETLKRHDAILDKVAQERGLNVVKTYYEVATGESIAARPEVQKLLEEVNAGLYTGVLVVDLERLARGNGADQGYISQVFQFTGTKIITPNKTYDPSNEFDEEYFEFGLFMSRREYKTINRRLVRGRESSATEGKYVGSIPPYGYDRVKLQGEKGYTLTLNPAEAPVVAQMFSMFLSSNGCRTIANHLTDARVPPRHGHAWSSTTIANILRNPVYIGKIKRGCVKITKSVENGVVKQSRRHLRSMADYRVFDGIHPPIVAEEDFLRVQDMLNQSRGAVKVRKDFALKNPFAGLLFCARCGKRVARNTLSAAGSNRERVRCTNGRSCHNGSADFPVVEQAILDALRTWLEGYKVKIDTVGYEEDIASAKMQLGRLAQETERLQAQLDNAYNLVEQGVYTLALFQSRRDKLMMAMADVDAQRQALEASLQQMTSAEAGQTSLIPQTEALLASYDDMTNEERNALLKTILHRIEYEKGADRRIILDLYPRLPKK